MTATFSMIGLEVDAHPGMAREVAAAGHMIANHTWSHVDLAVLPPVTVADQINRATDAIHTVTGRVPTLFRAPYGAWSPVVLQRCAQAGMTPLDWSVDPRDWSRPGVASIVDNIMRNTKTGSIILEHDGGGNRSQTVAALKIVLPRLLAAGYRFTTPSSPDCAIGRGIDGGPVGGHVDHGPQRAVIVEHRTRSPLAGQRTCRPNRYTHPGTGCSAVWLARRVWVAEVAGSNPASPTTKPGPGPPHGASRAAGQLGPLPVRGEPLTTAEHSEQRPDRLGDRLERLVVRQLR